MQLGHEEEGFRKLSDFVTRYPEAPLTPQVVFWLADAYKTRGDALSAHKYFERLIRYYPREANIPDAYLENGLVYEQEGALDAALRHYELAEQSGSEAVAGHAAVLAGGIHEKKGRLQEAMGSYRRAAAKASPWRKVAYARQGRLERENKNLKEAVGLLEQDPHLDKRRHGLGQR